MPSYKNCLDRFEILPADFEIGRSGIPGLARDKESGDRVFYKRADMHTLPMKFGEQVRNLANEAKALKELSGYHVPKIIDTCDYSVGNGTINNKKIPYLFSELLDQSDRLEQRYKNNESLPLLEKIEILLQLYETLAKAHFLNFINGDVDLKHLYWHRKKSKLFIIDWGNSEHDVSNAADFAFDIAKSAEIVHSLLSPSSEILEPSPQKNATPAQIKIPEIYELLYKWAPQRGRPESDEGIFTARNLLSHTKSFYVDAAGEFNQLLETWVPRWINNPSGDSWFALHQQSFDLAPCHPIVQIASECKRVSAKISEGLLLESQYRDFCSSDNWLSCIEIIDVLIQKQHINRRRGNWLKDLLITFEKNKINLRGVYKDSLSDVVWELLYENQILSRPDTPLKNSFERLGSAIIETLAWQLVPDLGIDIDAEWEQNSFSIPLKRLEYTIIEEIKIYEQQDACEKYQEKIDDLNNILSDLSKYKNRTQEQDKFANYRELLVDYQRLSDNLLKMQEYFGNADSEKGLGISDLLQRISNLKNILRSIIHNTQDIHGEPGKWQLVQALKSLWLKDRECWFLFELWYVEAKKLTPEFLGYGSKNSKICWRYNSELYYLLRFYKNPASNKTIREEIDLIQFEKKSNTLVYDASYTLRELIYLIDNRLPFSWQLDSKVIEFLCLLAAWADTLRLSESTPFIHKWAKPINLNNPNERLDLSSLVLANLDFRQVIHHDHQKELDSIFSSNQSGNTQISQLSNSNLGTPQTDIKLQNETYNVHSTVPEEAIKKTKNIERPHSDIYKIRGDEYQRPSTSWIYFKKYLLIMFWSSIAVIIFWLAFSFILWARNFPDNNHEETNYSIRQTENARLNPTITRAPEKNITPTLKPESQTLTPAGANTATIETTMPPTPSIFAIDSTLLQFDTRDINLNSQDIKNINRPASVILFPLKPGGDSSNIPVCPSTDAGCLFYNQNSLYWNFRSYSTQAIEKNPLLSEMYVSFGSQMLPDRMMRIQALSIIAEQTQFDDGADFGFFIRSDDHETKVIINRGNGKYSVILYSDNKLIQEKPIDRDLSTLNTVFRIYWQIEGQNTNVYFIADTRNKFKITDQSQMNYIGSVPLSGNITDVGLISYNSVDLLIDKLTAYGQ